MTTETHLAFAHPEERAAATAGPEPRDRISLRDHVVSVEIGAFQAERGTSQRVRFNVVVEVRPHPAPVHDDVDRILSYDRITEAIAAQLAAERLNLLETLAAGVAQRILAEPQAMRVFVRVEKLDRGPGALGVEIVRSREDAAQPADVAAVHPLVVCLDNGTLRGNLGTVLDGLQGQGAVLTVDLPEGPRPKAATPAAQARIDLLAMEQNAWALAASDPRIAVVHSRTEIDWAIRNGQMIVWAPSKLVMDAVDGPQCADAVTLALWLAGVLSARQVLIAGEAPLPAGSRVPVARLSR